MRPWRGSSCAPVVGRRTRAVAPWRCATPRAVSRCGRRPSSSPRPRRRGTGRSFATSPEPRGPTGAGCSSCTRGRATSRGRWLGTAQRVWASDSDRESIDLLRELAQRHGLPINAKRQSAERLLPRLAEASTEYDVIVLDPPRAGVGVTATAAACRVARDRIVYVSCDPATLARDLQAGRSTTALTSRTSRSSISCR